MQHRFRNWLADFLGRLGVRLLRLANRIEPPPPMATGRERATWWQSKGGDA